jgi:hypothetical protein
VQDLSSAPTAAGAQPTSPPSAEAEAVGQRVALFGIDGGDQLATDVDLQITVTVARSPEGTVIVPVSALWTMPDGATVVTRIGSGSNENVAVEPGMTSGGLVAVRSLGSALRPGDEVVVGYREGTVGR